MLIIIVYVDDIIFGSDDNSMSKSFETSMQKEFEMFIVMGKSSVHSELLVLLILVAILETNKLKLLSLSFYEK